MEDAHYAGGRARSRGKVRHVYPYLLILGTIGGGGGGKREGEGERELLEKRRKSHEHSILSSCIS